MSEDSQQRGRSDSSSSGSSDSKGNASGNDSSASSTFTSSQTDIPRSTSDWTSDHVNSLQITVHRSQACSPKNIIRMIFPITSFEKRAQNIAKDVSLCLGMKSLKFKSLNKIPLHNVKIFNSDGPMWEVDTEKESEWNNSHRFKLGGRKFGRYLFFLVLLSQQGKTLTEKMYQTLFQYFIDMFGVESYIGGAIPEHEMLIKGKKIVSIPDLLVMKGDPQLMQLVAVCEVKTDFTSDLFCAPTPPKRRKETDKAIRCRINHLSDKIIGQCGGELLLHFPSSASEHGILGIIIQQTNITFTHLASINKDDLDSIANGELLDTGVGIKFSRPYNFLDPDDREELIEPLLILGFIQAQKRQQIT